MTVLLYLAGITNIVGILLVTQGLQDDALINYYPQVFSRAGQIGILLWGLAYMACAPGVVRVPVVLLVFALEKFFYFGTWLAWAVFGSVNPQALLAEPTLVNLFMAGYGLGDLAFALLFVLAFVACLRVTAESPASATP